MCTNRPYHKIEGLEQRRLLSVSVQAPQSLTAAGSQLFFTVDDGIHGRELWVSDGTAVGTRLVADINPRSASGVAEAGEGEFIDDLPRLPIVAVNNTVF